MLTLPKHTIFNIWSPSKKIKFLAMLLFLHWNSALLYWDIPETNFSIGSQWNTFASLSLFGA